MRKIVTVYKPTKCIHETNVAYPTFNAAQRAVRTMPSWYPEGEHIEELQFEVPEDAFWTGDLISVELYRGGYDDDDGIHHGGKWQVPTTGRVGVTAVDLARNTVDGWIFDPNTNQHIQSLPLQAGLVGYPFRNAKLLADEP